MVIMAGRVTPRLRASGVNSPREAEAAQRSGGEREARALHERLVAYAHGVAGDPESRSGVWCEHSYARARDGAAAEVRELLGHVPPPPAAPSTAPLDVEHVPRDRAPELPALCDDAPLPPDDDDDDNDENDDGDEWQERLRAHAPSAAHARLADTAADALQELRLARLAGEGARRGGAWLRREQARCAARRLRRALAPLWARGAAPAWLHGALCDVLPRRERALYVEVLAELRRAVPRLAERLSPHLPPVPPDPLEPADEVLRPEPERRDGEEALLVWVCTGGAADERWLRRLRPLVRTRELRATGGAARLPPDRWCAAVTAEARARLHDLLIDAGPRYVVLGGAGAGAALCATLAAGGASAGPRPRALLLLAPPLLTAEGPRDEPDDILHEVRVPMLVVCGGGGAAGGRAAAAGVVAGRGAGAAGRGARRLLLLGAGDDALRVPPALRRALRLPQCALDAAIADECARWVREAARGRYDRHDRPPPDVELEEEEFEHLAIAGARAPGARVVSRVSGGTPLALVPPRRAPELLDAADILQLPIVFADDEPGVGAPPAAAAPSLAATAPGAEGAASGALTVRSGARGKLTRVIVARRGGRSAPRAPQRAPHRAARALL
ncbi:KAT8 regulatory NSL complex subunit 3 [Battus philenor]|uniref:KAT8 regulatory NSL complex subunit 3 n=1 Tax=Battus philenor TaxID=42288 RepID=UPI0035CF6CAF